MGTDSKNNDLVTLPYDSRDLGVTVLGQTGYGKTTLLEQLICQDIAQGTSVIVVDAHGDLTQSTINRLDQFLSSEFVATVVGSPTSTIPFDEVLGGDGRVLLLNLPVGEIGEGLCNLLGGLFLAVLTERIFARGKLPPDERPRVHLYLDEYGRYATPTTAQLLTEGRKFGIGTHHRPPDPRADPRRGEPRRRVAGGQPDLLSAHRRGRGGAVRGVPGHPGAAVGGTGRRDRGHRTDPGDRPGARRAAGADHPRRPEGADDRAAAAGPHPQNRRRSRARENNSAAPVNHLLVDVMEGRVDAEGPDVEEQLLTIFLWTWWRWRLDWVPYDHDSEEWKVFERSLRSFFSASLEYCPDGAAEGLTPQTAGRLREDPRVIELVDLLLIPWEKDRRRYHQPLGESRRNPGRHGRLDEFEYIPPSRRPLWGSELDKVIEEERPQERERIFRRAVEAAQRLCQLRYLCRALAAAPVMVPSGQERPRTRIRYVTHPQRSYQDVQNELAVELASLPRFTILCNIDGEQHRVRLAAPMRVPIDEERIGRVRRASKKRFGRGEDPLPAADTGPAGPASPPRGGKGAGGSRPIGRRSTSGGPANG